MKNNWVQDVSANTGTTYNKVVFNYLNKIHTSHDEKRKSSTSMSSYFELAENVITDSKVNESDDLDGIMRFVYNMLVSEDFGYGDTPELKYVVENIFSKNKSQGQMSFINMATRKVFISDSNTIEKFFALLMSLEESDIEGIALTIITMFSSHKDVCACEGALSLLDKFGKDEDALKIARNIRDFEYSFLNEYKGKVITNLMQYVKE
ncbi:hypothetical protein L1D04_03525 [Klebsiella pneumoniae]|uniref:hypothetical protein n=1 Tax=Klebsiella pneumoniae TaxID=573 RepID=UPI0011DD7C99|nr:hypothetical protein [Klebsiella pneumoniae]HCT5345662.1 hypothetical protein [Klebsiella quasipneumoniae]EIW8530638.1 hypothetical protein [Klebsiella pneumoniae]MBG1742316.1 hypothetical protein [Klebsiella pneumoniae]MBG1767868.1 hypothetical protein [Klebsiella pneumoniae]MBZ1588200.1 hypothetical protein [Klebsiella pneumoniae]